LRNEPGARESPGSWRPTGGTTALDSATDPIPAGVEPCSSCRGLSKCAHSGETSTGRAGASPSLPAGGRLHPCASVLVVPSGHTAHGSKENDMSTNTTKTPPAAAEIPQPAPTLTPEAVVEQLRALRAQLARNPENAVLLPHVQEVRRLKKFARRKKAAPAPDSPPAQAPTSDTSGDSADVE